MGKIPAFEQQQLASSLVGTPGVDQSGALLGTAVEKTAAGLGAEVEAQGKMEYAATVAAARQKAAEVRQAEKQLQTAQLNTRVGAYNQQFSVQGYAVDKELRGKYYTNTSGGSEDLAGRLQDLSDKNIQGITDPLERALALKAFQTTSASIQNGFGSFANDRRIPNMQNDLNGAAGALSVTLSDSSLSFEDVHRITDEYTKQLPSYALVYGPADGLALMHKDISDAIKERIADVAIHRPQDIEKEIDYFGAAIEPSKSEPFLREQRRFAAEVKARNNLQTKMEDMTSIMDAKNALVDASPTGLPKDAPPEVIREVRKNLTPNARLKLDATLSEFQKTSEIKQLQTQDDNTLVYNIGKQIPYINQLSTNVTRLHAEASKPGLTKEQRVAATEKLEIAIDKYRANYASLKVAGKTIKDPRAKTLVDTYIKQMDTANTSVLGVLTNIPQAVALRGKEAQFIHSVSSPSPYLGIKDAQRNSAFGFYYNSYARDEFEAAHKSGKLDSLLKNDNYLKKVKSEITRKVIEQVEAMQLHGK